VASIKNVSINVPSCLTTTLTRVDTPGRSRPFNRTARNSKPWKQPIAIPNRTASSDTDSSTAAIMFSSGWDGCLITVTYRQLTHKKKLASLTPKIEAIDA
jgi:hypothetical protein